jgi:dual specificity tyrosine-phosphorylation-regulated kinase 2/3/4
MLSRNGVLTLSTGLNRNRTSADLTTASSSRISSANAPMLSASSSNNHSLFSFGRNAGGGVSTSVNEVGGTAATYDFLPSVSFDDLQSSLESASSDFKLTQFPSPTGQGSILESQGLADKMSEPPSNVTHSGGTTRVVIPPAAARTNRSGSILRRPSLSNRQSGNLPNANPDAGVPGAPTAPAAMRNRRQSHYPPVSNSNIAKLPRKSIGPGVIDSDHTANRIVTVPRRRPSVASNADKGSSDSARTSMDSVVIPSVGDNTRSLTNSRASKARSVQPPSRQNYANLTINNNLVPDQNVASAISPRSPRATGSGRGSNASANNNNKRQSVMPGVTHASHATGLGARTISPTDTRRMKRMSTMPPAQSLNQVANAPPPPPPADLRPSSRSPSMIPRKASATPSSSRTTPDVNRKSYSSGLSVGSSMSFNTVRTSTGSIQARLPQSGSISRLPAPKSLNLHNPITSEDDEDVPPVPAIPKVYESPKESPAEMTFLDKKKANLAADASSIHSNSTGNLSIPPLEVSVRITRKLSARKSAHVAGARDMDKKGLSGQQKKNLQPLRLPPITLGPLSTPTAAKIAALQEQGQLDRNLSPPASRQIPKTPTTPMTASKSSFFSRNRAEDKTEAFLRSSSSIHHTHTENEVTNTAMSSTESLLSKKPTKKSSISPFLSSSAPKGTVGVGFMKRSETGADFATITENPFEGKHVPKLTGPRAQTASKSTTKSPQPLSSPEDPPTPGSISSIRRKLSMSWKRAGSKSSIVLPPGVVDKGPDHLRQESMPPPRLPVSSTMNSVGSVKASSPTPSTKSTGTYLESRRRKSSASSLNAIMAQDRTRVDSWRDRSPKKEPGNDSLTERLTLSRNSSVMQKILKPKPSAGMIRHIDSWTADLDKDDLVAEEEMRKMGLRRKETEIAARTLDALRKRATPKERVSAHEAIRIAMLNIYERGEIVDYDNVYFCGTQNACKVVGDLQSSAPNFGYDDERGDYTIIHGDHLAYRYEIIDILGKGSFGQVVRCIDHKNGVLVAVKIIRNKKRFHQQALVEVNILKKLREWVSAPII